MTSYIDVNSGFTLISGFVVLGAGLAGAAITTWLGLRAYKKWAGKSIG